MALGLDDRPDPGVRMPERLYLSCGNDSIITNAEICADRGAGGQLRRRAHRLQKLSLTVKFDKYLP
jgi:hypothetical protein